ncbi:MAG: DUF5309 family protein [Cyanobacteria bacterium P01_G01_bin.4]
MAAISGTTSTYSTGAAGGNREDLEDTIHELFADENYFSTNLDSVSASAVLHEWLGDELRSPAANRAIEGNDTTFSTVVQPIRYNNYCQILEEELLISGTQEVVNKAGRTSEVGRQAIKKMRELANDFEYALVRNQIATAGGTGTGRSLAGMESWIGSATTGDSSSAFQKVIRATTTASASTAPVAAGAPGTAPVDGSTVGALTEDVLRLGLESNWQNGSTTDCIAVNATAKNFINDFTGVAQRQIDVGRGQQASIVGAADLYVSNYGTHKVILHRHVRDSVALLLDSSLWAVGTLRPWASEPLAKTGDAEKRLMNGEKTLVCRNPNGNAKIVAIG